RSFLRMERRFSSGLVWIVGLEQHAAKKPLVSFRADAHGNGVGATPGAQSKVEAVEVDGVVHSRSWSVVRVLEAEGGQQRWAAHRDNTERPIGDQRADMQ